MSLSNQAIINFNDGNRLYKVNLFTEALDQYKKAVDVDPTFYNAHFCLAKTFLRLKRYDEGVHHFKKFIHLIPEDKQSEYLLALSNILVDEKQPDKAISTIEELNINFNNTQTLSYVELLLNNDKVSKAIHHIFQLKASDFKTKDYKQILGNKSYSEITIQNFCKEDIIPRFFSSQNRLVRLKKAEIRNKDLTTKLDNASRLIELIKTNENIDYCSKIEELEKEIMHAQDIVFTHAQTLFKTNKIELSNRVILTLESTNYDFVKTQELRDEIKELEKKKANSKIKKVALSIAVVLLIGLASYFGYNFYQLRETFKAAVDSEQTIDSPETLELVDYKQDFFIIGENDQIELFTFKSINSFLGKTHKNISLTQLTELNGDLNKKTGDTIYLSEVALNTYRNSASKTIISLDEVMPFEFVEQPPQFGNCNSNSNVALKKCFTQNLTTYLNTNASLKHFQTLGLSDGNKEVKYSLTISKDGTPTNIKVWADHPEIESDIQSVIANINGFEPGSHEGNIVGVVYNSIFNFRVGEKPKQPESLKTLVKNEKVEENETELEPLEDIKHNDMDTYDKPIPIPKEHTFYTVERAPVFPGCESTDDPIMFTCTKDKINSFILNNINYKKLAVVEDKAYKAKVNISFKINATGNVTSSIVTCDSLIDSALKDSIIEQVKEAVKSLPNMQPALLRGENVEVNYEVGLILEI
ncbi:tetratricopeptide repeat protein [Psychroserpens mesophilus]|uniref:tetratricopeptide repeat protein n=1 Tax=Psychroserpens mesophilus TaxID=325473 RepID=UPI003F498300